MKSDIQTMTATTSTTTDIQTMTTTPAQELPVTGTQTTEAHPTCGSSTPTLDQALARIAELEQSLADKEHDVLLEVSNRERRERTVEKLAKDVSRDIHWRIADAVGERLDEIESSMGANLGYGLFDEAAEGSEAAEHFMEGWDFEDAFPVLGDLLDGLEADIRKRVVAISAEAEKGDAFDALPESVRRAANDLNRMHHAPGLLGEAVALGLKINEAAQAGRDVSPEAGTPEAAEIATAKVQLAHKLVTLARNIDSARPADVPALLTEKIEG